MSAGFESSDRGVEYWTELDPESVIDLPPEWDEILYSPDTAAARIADIAPGDGVYRAVVSVVPGRLSNAGLLDLITGSQRLLAALQARQDELLAEVARRDPQGEEFLRDETALATKIAPITTGLKIATAEQLSGRLHDTHLLCRAGELSGQHARILSDAVRELDDAVTARVQAAVLPQACEQTPGEFRASVAKAIAKFDTRNTEKKHRDAFSKRRVEHYPEASGGPPANEGVAGGGGMATVTAVLGADGAAALMAAVNAAASVKVDGDTRTPDQRRADALVSLAHAALCDPTLPTAHGARPAINVTVGLATLLGCSDAPALLDGCGWITAEAARRIAADPSGTWRRLITDKAGRLLDYQDTVYKPPAQLTRHVIHRDQRCVMPGCRRKAYLCDQDHRVPFPVGGTNVENLQSLCRRHHRMKHHRGTSVTKDDDGSYRWRTPSGKQYRYVPETLPPPDPDEPPKVTVAQMAPVIVDPDEPPPF